LFRKIDGWSLRYQKQAEVYAFTESWRFVLVVRPWMVTEMYPVDSELESRVKQIDNYFERRGIKRYPYRWWGKYLFIPEKYAYAYTNKPMRDIVAEAQKNCVENDLHNKQDSLWEI